MAKTSEPADRKVKITVWLSVEVRRALDELVTAKGQRSALVERAVREFLERRDRKRTEMHERVIDDAVAAVRGDEP